MCVNVEKLNVKILWWLASPCNKKKSGFSDGKEKNTIVGSHITPCPIALRMLKKMLKVAGGCLEMQETHC